MSGLPHAAGLWTADKTVALTTHTKHKHVPSPISAHFEAPDATSSLSFGPIALAAAIARTATTRDAPVELLVALQESALVQLECLVADGSAFALSPHLDYLADTERLLFAARLGAGIADLYMNSLGYTWRANAASLSSTLDPHADFIYEGGKANGHGVVLTEAHGSFAANASVQSIAAQAKRKYMRQVKPYVASGSPYGQVIHGYSIAFGSKPGTTGGFLGLAETRIRKSRKKAASPPPERPASIGSTPTPIILSAHRSNFLLMGTRPIVDWIDWIRGLGEMPADDEAVEFFKLQYAGRRYLGSTLPVWTSARLRWWLEEFWDHPRFWSHPVHRRMSQTSTVDPLWGWFVMEETACESFLEALSGIIRNGKERIPEQLELPSFDVAGFGSGDGGVARSREHTEYNYALFRDGLALLAGPTRRVGSEIRVWSPTDGLKG